MKNKMTMKIKAIDWSLACILVLGLVLRVVYLTLKPPHFDEGINGWFLDQMISQGYYRYDPTNYHGPLHFYFLFIFKLLFGRNLLALRLPTALFGTATVYLITRFKQFIGKRAAYIAAFFMAISCGMVFYSRYAIHESELLFFSVLATLGFIQFREKKDRLALWFMAIGITGMFVTKETFVIHLACFGIAILCVKFYETVIGQRNSKPPVIASYTSQDVNFVTTVSLIIAATLFSGFFLNSRGLLDSMRSFAVWFQTGTKGNGHEKPFFYWLSLLKQYEWASLTGLILCLRLLWPVNRTVRLIGVYGIGVLLAYSIVPYKTAWCVINLTWPFMIVAGFVLVEAAQKNKKMLASVVVGILILTHFDLKRTIDLNFYHFDDETEPYVYVQTFRDIMGINQKLRHVIAKDPKIRFMPFNILMESSWPLPWLWGDLWQGNFAGRPIPPNPDAMLILVDAPLKTQLESRLKLTYFKQIFRLRSAQGESIAYFDAQVFKDEFLPGTTTFKPQSIEPLKANQGLTAKFFTNEKWAGIPAHIRHVADIDFVWTETERPMPAPFSISYEGEIFIPHDEPIVFSLASDDGSSLEIDGKVVIDNLGAHPEKTVEQLYTQTKGWHKIVIRYNDFGGGMMARLMWKLDITYGNFETVGQENFKPSAEYAESR